MAELVQMFYLYILKSQIKNWHYIGSTDNVSDRLRSHNSGATKSTRPYRPLKLIYTEEYGTKKEALVREYFIKKNYKAREALYNKISHNGLIV